MLSAGRCSVQRLRWESVVGAVIVVWYTCLITFFSRSLIFFDCFEHKSGAVTINVHRAESCAGSRYLRLQPWAVAMLLINAIVTSSPLVFMVYEISRGRGRGPMFKACFENIYSGARRSTYWWPLVEVVKDLTLASLPVVVNATIGKDVAVTSIALSCVLAVYLMSVLAMQPHEELPLHRLDISLTASQLILLSAAGALTEKTTAARELILLLVLLPTSLMPLAVAAFVCLTLVTAVLPERANAALMRVWVSSARLRRCVASLGFQDAAADGEEAKRYLQALLQQDPCTKKALLAACEEKMDPLEARQLLHAIRVLFAVARADEHVFRRPLPPGVGPAQIALVACHQQEAARHEAIDEDALDAHAVASAEDALSARSLRASLSTQRASRSTRSMSSRGWAWREQWARASTPSVRTVCEHEADGGCALEALDMASAEGAASTVEGARGQAGEWESEGVLPNAVGDLAWRVLIRGAAATASAGVGP
ncbi:unnamed protein product [Prorocentrum cordatum]|uniref:Uncharacterized protein n=1 Tax=Prorocentrum cordatum TaxID=2364126 RepID=A0ABN9W546_9DINO|nr:unnamed protein product [Polarella glacialis]